MRIKHIDLLVIGFIFLILFTMPAMFVRIDGIVSWKHVFKIWQDNALLIPLFVINHWLLLPRMIEKKRYSLYLLSMFLLLVLTGFICNYIDPPAPESIIRMNAPSKIPPYATMLMYAVLIVGVDVGMFFSRMWQINEKRTLELEKRSSRMELELLRNQVSPHFFMNTLNNIYALVDLDSARAKEAVMKLSKLMRYLLYENNNGTVKLSKEFEFISCYIDLMRIRYTKDVVFELDLPTDFKDINIPPMLFICYVENAVKYGVSYQERCVIRIAFRLEEKSLYFECGNPIHRNEASFQKGGIGLKNSQSRLSLIFVDDYDLTITENESLYSVKLRIPIE